MIKWFLRVVSSCLALVTIGASIFRTEGWYLHEMYWAQEYLGGDKVVHLWSGGILMLTAVAWSCAWRSHKRLAIHCAIILLGILAEECTQMLTPSRQFSMLDYAYSAAGVMTVTFCVFVFQTIRPVIAQRRLHLSS